MGAERALVGAVAVGHGVNTHSSTHESRPQPASGDLDRTARPQLEAVPAAYHSRQARVGRTREK